MSPYWTVARTLVHREPVAARLLQAAGFEIFAPKTHAGPLFPGYIFVRVVDHWRVIDRTVGVLKLVRFGDAPARCPDAEIAKLQGQVDDRGLVRLPARPPKPVRGRISIGAKVRIAGLSAIYIGATARERERILINLLGREVTVELRPGQLADPVYLAQSQHPR